MVEEPLAQSRAAQEQDRQTVLQLGYALLTVRVSIYTDCAVSAVVSSMLARSCLKMCSQRHCNLLQYGIIIAWLLPKSVLRRTRAKEQTKPKQIVKNDTRRAFYSTFSLKHLSHSDERIRDLPPAGTNQTANLKRPNMNNTTLRTRSSLVSWKTSTGSFGSLRVPRTLRHRLWRGSAR